MKNTFGSAVSLTIFGESHGPAIGAVLDGLAAGLPVEEQFIAECMDRRRARGDGLSTSRTEPDRVEILSGVLDGHTTGTPRHPDCQKHQHPQPATTPGPPRCCAPAMRTTPPGPSTRASRTPGAADTSPVGSPRPRWRRGPSASRCWQGWESRCTPTLPAAPAFPTPPCPPTGPCPPRRPRVTSLWWTPGGRPPCRRPSAPPAPPATAWAASWRRWSPACPPVWANPSSTAWRVSFPT